MQHAAPTSVLSHLDVPVDTRFFRTTLGSSLFTLKVTSEHLQHPGSANTLEISSKCPNTQDRQPVPNTFGHKMSVNITNERASYQAVSALDLITAADALTLLILATRPMFKRIIARRFTSPSNSSSRDAPLKTTLGTYLFLWPALLCLFIAYVARFANDLLKTSGRIAYEIDLVWNGRTAYDAHGRHRTSISALSFTTGLATIVFTVLLNGGVWIHSSQVQENGTAISIPKTDSKIWNTLIMLAMLGTGVGAWGRGMSERDVRNGSLGPNALSSWSNVLHHDQATRIVYIVHEAIVVAASLSVTIEVLNEYKTTNKCARCTSDFVHSLTR